MHPDAQHLWRGPRWALAILLALLGMVGPFSIDTYLPAFPAISQALAATPVQMQQTLSAYLFAFAFMTLFHGSLSDSFGRRPVVLWGLAVFTLASMGCALSQSIGQLVVFRALQGLSAGAGIVVSRAVIRDIFPPTQAQRVMSQVTIFFGVAPAIAPMVGGWLSVHLGWHSVFWFLTGVGMLLWLANWRLLPESLPPQGRQRLHLGRMCAPPFTHAPPALGLHHRAPQQRAKDYGVARLAGMLGQHQLHTGRPRAPGGQQGLQILRLQEGLVAQQHQQGVNIGRQRRQAAAQRPARALVGRGVEHPAQGHSGPGRGLRQHRLQRRRMVAQHHHHRADTRLAQQADLAQQQRLAVALQQGLGEIAHAPARASGHDHGGHGIHRAHQPTLQAEPAAAWPWLSLTWATSMSRGSGTPFFTASTSAMTLTAISGGVLLPM